MPQKYSILVLTEEELRQHPEVVRVLDADGIPAVWQNDVGETEKHFEVSCIEGLAAALKAAFPEVGDIDVLVVQTGRVSAYPFSIPSHVKLLGAESADDYVSARECDHCGEQVMTLYHTRNTDGEEAMVCGECLAQMLGYQE